MIKPPGTQSAERCQFCFTIFSLSFEIFVTFSFPWSVPQNLRGDAIKYEPDIGRGKEVEE